MLQPSEAFQLLLAVFFAPFIYGSLKDTWAPFRLWILVALGALFLSYTFTIVEGFIAPDLFNVLEHAMLAVCGVSFAMAAAVGARRWHARSGGEAS
jgi:hypothetical protein